MRTTLNGKPALVRFRYTWTDPAPPEVLEKFQKLQEQLDSDPDFRGLKLEPNQGKRLTEAFILNVTGTQEDGRLQTDVVGYGKAVKDEVDNFCRRTGRWYALERAMKAANMTHEQRDEMLNGLRASGFKLGINPESKRADMRRAQKKAQEDFFRAFGHHSNAA